MGRYTSNTEHGAANLVTWALRVHAKHGEIDAGLLDLARQMDEKLAALKDELLGGAGEAVDTLRELADLIAANADAIDALRDLAAGHVKFDAAQDLTASQQAQARSNIGAVSAEEMDAAIEAGVEAGIPDAPTASVTRADGVAVITITDRTGTTRAEVRDGERGWHYTPSLDEEGNLSWSNDGGLANPASKNIMGPAGPQGPQGVTFTPSVSSTGVLSWTNDGDLSNPASRNITGPQGAQGEKGDTGAQGPQGAAGAQGPRGYTFTPSVSTTGVLSWTNDGSLSNPAARNIKGPQGARGVTFTPSVSSSGVLSWTNNGGLSNPASVNIKGPQGDAPDVSLFLTKEEYAEGFDGGDM